ncbi:MAG: VOC family protein [Halobacteriaceae archaeon]
MPPSLPAESHIGRVALRVADGEPVVDFYRDVVGLAVLDESGDSTTLGVEGEPSLVVREDPDLEGRSEDAAGLYHTAFRVPDRAALGDALHRIRADWHLDGAADHLVSEALYCTDPAGNGVEVYRDRPREEWPRGEGGGVEMATDPLDLGAVAGVAAGESVAPAGTDVGHVHLEVTSLSEFAAVYEEGVGFTLQTTMPGARFVGAGGYHHHVGANVWQHRSDPAAGEGLDWFEVVVPDDEALVAVGERLENAAVALEERDDWLALEDEDGIGVRVRSDRPA